MLNKTHKLQKKLFIPHKLRSLYHKIQQIIAFIFCKAEWLDF